nr:cysteine-rich DPF motif domain-containing protein 1 isoform X1 [Loxodonta africana]
MASEAERRPQGMFECQLCALSAPYSYVGQKPPDTRSVVLLEESYILKDPFTADRDKFLVLGSRCSVCSRLVCVGPQALSPPHCPVLPQPPTRPCSHLLCEVTVAVTSARALSVMVCITPPQVSLSPHAPS